MIVRLGPEGGPSLDEPNDCTRFHLEAPASVLASLGERLGEAGTTAGAPEGHAWVDIAWVRAQAEGRVPETWPGDFDGMLAYARTKGWLDAGGTAIQAHVVAS
jgi:hypothetical protein